MSKPIIAVDIDEVLMPHFHSLIVWYNRKYGTKLTDYDNHPTDPGNWGTQDIQEAVRRVHLFYETEDFKQSRPHEGAMETLKQLSRMYHLVIVTGRDTILEKATQDWLQEHFTGIFGSIHLTKHFNQEGKKVHKSQVLLQLGAKFFIEDSLEYAFDAANKGIKTILFGDYDWNQTDELPKGVTRCKNWQEVAEYFGV